MFVRITEAGALTLEEIDNFRRFEIRSSADFRVLQAAIDKIGRLEGSHLWLAGEWIRNNGRPNDPEWLAGFNKMMDFANRSGWIDESGAVRAHIEYV